MGAKLVLSRLPISYRVWQSLSLFRHGEMDDAAYALAVWSKHWRAGGIEGKRGAVVAEIGPGDSLLTAIAARAHGAGRCWLVDAGRFAEPDAVPARAFAKLLRDRGLAPPSDDELAGSDWLAACGATYLTDGVRSLATIPSGSVDLVFSHAALEHVRRGEVPRLLAETRRILAPGGKASHAVDLTDHMGGGLNQLRFSERFWEDDRIARSGFYTNRLSCEEWRRAFEAAGFAVASLHPSLFPAPPIDRARLAPAFRDRTDDELLVNGFDVVLEAR